MKRSIISLLLLFCFISSWAQINDTYWRDDKTGDWLLGITDKNIIYDCKIWDISSVNEKKGSFSITATNNGQLLALNISKEKDSQRTITINKQKHVCSLITSEFLPDYPEKDTRTDFTDNHYRKGDSVTIVGWIRDTPESLKDEEFWLTGTSVYDVDNLITKVDSLGLFSFRMPVWNSTYYSYRDLNILVEPNETYFILLDRISNQTLFMGKNARVLNEINHYKISPEVTNYYDIKDFDATAFLAKNESIKNIAIQQLDSICNEHPTLSVRFKTFWQNNIHAKIADILMQGRFKMPNFKVSDEYFKVVTDEYIKKIQEPYTTCGNFCYFMTDYADNIEKTNEDKFWEMVKYGIFSADKAGITKLSEQEKQHVEDFVTEYNILQGKLNNTTDTVAKKKLIEEYENKDFCKTFNKLSENKELNEYVRNKLESRKTYYLLEDLKALGFSQNFLDMYLCQKLIISIDKNRIPLSQRELAICNDNIQSQAVKDYVYELSDKYEAISKRMLSDECLKSNDIVKGLSDGEQIFKKLVEPYKGKIILIDVWGTWCGPCKYDLSHSQEEYERLKPYDMVFMYLANTSPEESWKNVIKEYNVTGDNVVHYRLPDNQQKAVQEYLKVEHYPTNRLVDKDGSLLDVEVYVGDLPSLEDTINKLTGKQ